MSKQLSAGAALEKVIRDDLPEHVEFDPREEALLKAAAQQLDDIAALEADIRARGHVVDGPRQPFGEGDQTRPGGTRAAAVRHRPSCGGIDDCPARRASREGPMGAGVVRFRGDPIPPRGAIEFDLSLGPTMPQNGVEEYTVEQLELAWRAYGTAIMDEWPRHRPGFRPWAFWQWEVGEHPEDREAEVLLLAERGLLYDEGRHGPLGGLLGSSLSGLTGLLPIPGDQPGRRRGLGTSCASRVPVRHPLGGYWRV